MRKKSSASLTLKTTDAELWYGDFYIGRFHHKPEDWQSPTPTPPEEPEKKQAIPLHRNGCPTCDTKALVTEQKYHGKRICRCRECGWRGEMEG